MITLDQKLLNRRYNQLYEATVRKSAYLDYGTTEISFSEGLWRSEEWYKRDVWNDMQKELQLDTWEEHKEDPKHIIGRVLGTMKRMCENGKEQNLVSNQNITVFMEILYLNPKAAADVLFQVFMSDDDGKAFDALAKLLSKKKMNDPISIASYLFFLKDKEKYVPARKQGTGERLALLGVSYSLLHTCSWSVYSEYLQIVKQIQDYFLECRNQEIEFLDAQSFLWMLHMIDDQTPEYPVDEIDDGETAVTIARKEGRKTEYYVKKYERDPRNRRDAIREHGYTCMACGFNFQEKYGKIGEQFIEVHHVVPLSSIHEEVMVNPKTDLVCLCSNCHSMIHRKKNAILTVEELKNLIQR